MLHVGGGLLLLVACNNSATSVRSNPLLLTDGITCPAFSLFILLNNHVMVHVLCHCVTAGPHIADRGDSIHIWRVKASVLTKLSRTLNKLWFSKSPIFWDITAFNQLKFYRRFGGTYRLHIEGTKLVKQETSMKEVESKAC
jgi:hypothetical protein